MEITLPRAFRSSSYKKEMYMRIRTTALWIAVIGLTLQVASAQLPGTRRTDLQRHDLSAAGHEVIQARVDIAPGVTAPRHRHPGEEIVYVIEGTLEYQVEGKPPVTLEAGDVLFIPDGAVHSAKNVGTGNGAELATYVVRKGEPLVRVVP